MNVWQYIGPLNLNEASQRFLHAQPFPHICFDNFLTEDFAQEVEQAFPDYQQATRVGRGFAAVNERGKVQITDSNLFPPAIHQLHTLLSSPEFLQIMSQVTGITELMADEAMVGGGIHETGPRGHLDVHVDFNRLTERNLYRRLNILIFFNKDWQDRWGGSLELWDKDVKHCHNSMLPLYNRCVIFETSEISYHGVTAVTCPPTVCRKSFAAYYYTEDAGEQVWPKTHSTIFRARPQERWKRWVAMPLENAGRMVSQGKGRLKSAIKRMVGRERVSDNASS